MAFKYSTVGILLGIIKIIRLCHDYIIQIVTIHYSGATVEGPISGFFTLYFRNLFTTFLVTYTIYGGSLEGYMAAHW